MMQDVPSGVIGEMSDMSEVCCRVVPAWLDAKPFVEARSWVDRKRWQNGSIPMYTHATLSNCNLQTTTISLMRVTFDKADRLDGKHRCTFLR